MVVSITGIVINIVMVIIIISLIIVGVMFNRDLHTCETQQSTFCYTIQCPCDSPPNTQGPPPCFGYAKMPAGNPGQWYCSNAPLTVVDDSGNIV
jgi:hypothetical protein